MSFPTENFGDVAVVHTPEELGRDQALGFENFVKQLSRSKVVVDIDGTESLDSEGLATFLTLQECLQEIGGDLKITTTNTANRKILEITRLDQHLEVHESVIDAVKSYM
jgi:anti-anti-sigma factor